MSLSADLAATGRILTEAASAESFTAVRAALATAGLTEAALREVLRRVSHGPRDTDEFLALRARVMGPAVSNSPTLFERYVLLQAARGILGALESQPIPDGAKRLLLEEFRWLTAPSEQELRWLAAGTYEFSAWCKLVTLRRFPAGQLHWEVDGLPRRMLLHVPFRSLPRLARGIARLGGFKPTLVPHLAWRRRQIVLSEREHHRSLHLIAEALALQPRLRGYVAAAWFYSPTIASVSPHLAWAPRLVTDAGGTVIECGPAGAESGVFTNARARREAAAAGRFHPTLGLVLWPRDAMLRWAESARPSRGSGS